MIGQFMANSSDWSIFDDVLVTFSLMITECELYLFIANLVYSVKSVTMTMYFYLI